MEPALQGPLLQVRAQARGEAARCAYCHDEAAGLIQVCSGCGTSLHVTCRFLLRRCPTLGCVHEKLQKPRRIRVRPNVDGPEESGPTGPGLLQREAHRIERLIWAVVAASLLVMAGVMVGPVVDHSRSKVRADLSSIGQAARLFRLNTKRWPTCVEELLTPPHDVADRWRGPYLEDEPTDPWGHAYRLYPGTPPIVMSLGADGLAGGSEDATDVVQVVRGGRGGDY